MALHQVHRPSTFSGSCSCYSQTKPIHVRSCPFSQYLLLYSLSVLQNHYPMSTALVCHCDFHPSYQSCPCDRILVFLVLQFYVKCSKFFNYLFHCNLFCLSIMLSFLFLYHFCAIKICLCNSYRTCFNHRQHHCEKVPWRMSKSDGGR